MKHSDHHVAGGSSHQSLWRGPRLRTLAVVGVLSALAGVPGLWAQTTAAIQGTVRGPENRPLQGARVAVTGEQGSKTVTTDEKGVYVIRDLPPGTYRVIATLEPFAPYEVDEVELSPNQTRTLDLVLEQPTFSGEVLVSVQKRTETLLDVPASVTVLPGATLEEQRVEDLLDLVPLVPGLTVTSNTPGVTRVTLRGINTGGVASTVGVYIGEVPFGSSSGLANGAVLAGDFDTFDMARIEVLRGPQGTLYGASSLGGVLKYVPNLPSTRSFDARFLGSLETVEDGGLGYSVKGMVNAPLSESWALRASGFYRFDDGFIDSIGDNPIPSLTNPAVNIIDGTLVEEDLNSYDSAGGRIAALFAPSEKLSLLLVAQTQKIESDAPNEVDGDPITLEPLYSYPVESRYYPQTFDTTYEVYSATLNWDFGPASLVSVSGYSKFEQDQQLDATIASGLTGGPPLASLVTYLFGDDVTKPLSAILPETVSTDKYTQELRLVSPNDETFEWLVGGYYTHEDSQVSQEILAIDADTGAIASGVPDLAVLALPSTYREYAMFANGTWHITPRLDLSLGARTSHNKQVASQVADGPLVGGHVSYPRATSSESPFTWSVSPLFNLSKSSSVYARVATGFRPGGPNVLPPGVPEDTPLTYNSDTLTSYEAGWKTSGSDGLYSLDLSVFYQDWKDIQLLAVVNGFGINGNGGTAVSKGAEFTASFIPADGLTVSLNGAYTDAYLTQSTDPIVGGLKGDPLPYVPEWTFGLMGDYQWTVRGDSTMYVGGGVSYTGDRSFAFDSRAPDGSLRTIDSYVTADLRTGLLYGRWSFELYGKNLTDAEGITSVDTGGSLPNGAYGLGLIRPRTIGLSVGVRFWGS